MTARRDALRAQWNKDLGAFTCKYTGVASWSRLLGDALAREPLHFYGVGAKGDDGPHSFFERSAQPAPMARPIDPGQTPESTHA
jgi:hypothetical protein